MLETDSPLCHRKQQQKTVNIYPTRLHFDLAAFAFVHSLNNSTAMALVLKEKICLTTPQGVSEVQLLFGDITQLPVEEKVDTVFVSAFPGEL